MSYAIWKDTHLLCDRADWATSASKMCPPGGGYVLVAGLMLAGRVLIACSTGFVMRRTREPDVKESTNCTVLAYQLRLLACPFWDLSSAPAFGSQLDYRRDPSCRQRQEADPTGLSRSQLRQPPDVALPAPGPPSPSDLFSSQCHLCG